MNLIALGYGALFLACALTDLIWLRIPNLLVLALVALFAVACVVAPPPLLIWGHIVPALVAFAVAASLFYWGKFGGGDVKLFAAAVLWVGAPALGPFLIALAIFGTIAVVIFGYLNTQVAGIVVWAGAYLGREVPLPASLQTNKSVPYGMVIAAAALSIGPAIG